MEQGQLKWEDKNAGDTFRSKYLQRAERAAGMGKSMKVQGSSDGGVAMPRGQPCGPFQTNRCVFSSHHKNNGRIWCTCVQLVYG